MRDSVEPILPASAKMRRTVVRWTSLAAAALLVSVLIVVAVGVRYPLRWDAGQEPRATLSQIYRPPARVAPAPRPRAPPPRQEAPEPVPPSPAAAPAPAEAITITDPQWLARPRNPERYYPREAFMQGVDGRVELDCMVELDGRMRCTVVSEAPTGRGFGEAALALAHAHVMRPPLANGVAVRGRYRMIVPFSTER